MTVSDFGRHATVSVDGWLDRRSREELRRALLRAIDEGEMTAQVAVDLRRAVFGDDWAWATLADAHRRLAAAGRRLFVIAKPQGATHRRMEHLGLGTLLSRVDHPDALCRLRCPRVSDRP